MAARPTASSGGNGKGHQRVTARAKILWKFLAALFVACALASLVAWGVLLTSFCSHSRTPVPQAQQVITYSCHGMIVYITPVENAMRDWLIPLGGVFVFLGLLAGAMVVLGSAKIRIDVKIDVRDESNRSAH